VYSWCILGGSIYVSGALILYTIHTVLLLYSHSTPTVLTLYSYCTHTVLTLHSYCTHSALVRSTVYGMDRMLEGTIAAIAGPATGLLAEHVFGYTVAGGGSSAGSGGGRYNSTATAGGGKGMGGEAGGGYGESGGGGGEYGGSGEYGECNAANAKALGSGLFWVMAVPWVACLVLYGALHWSYQQDRQRYCSSSSYCSSSRAGGSTDGATGVVQRAEQRAEQSAEQGVVERAYSAEEQMRVLGGGVGASGRGGRGEML
jgi:hypothetical protein